MCSPPGRPTPTGRSSAQNLGANDIVTLNAGTYHIVSYFGDVNAVVRADLRVEPGQLTDATLYHSAAQISFKLVSETGGEAIADVDWTVKTADGTTVFTNTGTFPSTVLRGGRLPRLRQARRQGLQPPVRGSAGPAQRNRSFDDGLLRRTANRFFRVSCPASLPVL